MGYDPEREPSSVPGEIPAHWPGNCMSQFMFTVRRLLGGPLSVLAGPFVALQETFSQSERGRMFVLSLPALFMFFAGMALLVASQIGREARLVQRYDELAKKANLDGDALVEDYLKSRRLLDIELMKQEGRQRETGNAVPGGAAGVPEASVGDEWVDDGKLKERREKFQKVMLELAARRQEEQLHLQKLMSLKPDQPEYQFRYAKSKLPLDEEAAVSLIRQLAPLDEASGRSAIGYGPAHAWMARYVATRPNTTEREFQAKLLEIDKHATRALAVNPQDIESLTLRAQSLRYRNELGRAAEDYQRLFEADPGFYQALMEVNVARNRADLNVDLLDRASGRLNRELALNRDDTQKWETRWQQYASCMMQRKQFNELRRELESHRRDLASEDPRSRFLGQILAAAFSQRVNELLPRVATNPVDAEEAMQIIEAAGKAGAMSEGLKYGAAVIARNLPAMRARALAAYDPANDPDPPAEVLSDLAIDALSRKEYNNAIKILERARAKQPRSPFILNNLAFSYLSAETANPERALDLVNQAIREVVAQSGGGEEIKQQLSRFFHTRGTALLQLNRPDDARAAFLEALAGRPDNELILESLLMTYEGRDEEQAAAIRRRLEQVRAAAAGGNPQSGAAGNVQPPASGGSTPPGS